MNGSTEVATKWYQVIINDYSLNFSSNGIWEILQGISSKICAKFGVIEHLEAGPKKGKINSFVSLEDSQWEPMEMGELLRLVESIGHIDWGDFYLFQIKPKVWEWDYNEKMSKLVAESNTTIRVINGTLFYVHTPSKEIVEMIKESYATAEQIKFTELENHVYPY